MGFLDEGNTPFSIGNCSAIVDFMMKQAQYRYLSALVERGLERLPEKAPARVINRAKDARIAAEFWVKMDLERAIAIVPEDPKQKRGRRM